MVDVSSPAPAKQRTTLSLTLGVTVTVTVGVVLVFALVAFASSVAGYGIGYRAALMHVADDVSPLPALTLPPAEAPQPAKPPLRADPEPNQQDEWEDW